MRHSETTWRWLRSAIALCMAAALQACEHGPPAAADAANREEDPPRLGGIQTPPEPEACREVVNNRSHPVAARITALEILSHATNPQNRANGLSAEWRDRWQALGNLDAWLEDMRWWVVSFGTLPRGRYECDAIRNLREPEHRAMVQLALATHTLLAEQTDYLPSPRFIQTLAVTDAATARFSRLELLANLSVQLGALKHVRREPSSPNGLDDNPETLSSNQNKLSRGDLLTIRLLLEGLKSPPILRALDQVSRADRADRSTEFGGVLSMESDGLHLIVIPPMLTGNDMAYVTSDEAFRRLATGLAPFHLHTESGAIEDLAGPGVGDLKFAQTVHASCVVVTSLGAGRYDVDYYNPEMAVIDLGIYTVGD